MRYIDVLHRCFIIYMLSRLLLYIVFVLYSANSGKSIGTYSCCFIMDSFHGFPNY